MSTAPQWLDMAPKQFDTEAPDVQLSLFAPGSSGELADLFPDVEPPRFGATEYAEDWA